MLYLSSFQGHHTSPPIIPPLSFPLIFGNLLLDGNVLAREPREFSTLVIRDTGRVGVSSEGIASLRDMPSVQYAANIVIRQIGRRRRKGKGGKREREKERGRVNRGTRINARRNSLSLVTLEKEWNRKRTTSSYVKPKNETDRRRDVKSARDKRGYGGSESKEHRHRRRQRSYNYGRMIIRDASSCVTLHAVWSTPPTKSTGMG